MTPIGEWFKNYAVACILGISALAGGSFWMAEKTVLAQTSALRADINQISRTLRSEINQIALKQRDIENDVSSIKRQQEVTADDIAAILKYVRKKEAEEKAAESSQ